MGIKNDYRVSKIVVLCKDCNEDVGLYPARHTCNTNNIIKKPNLPTLVSSTKSSYTTWNENMKHHHDTPLKPAKLWEKIMNVSMLHGEHDDTPESDEDNWEGETHVSRILREYYEKKSCKLPKWLYDDRTPIIALARLDPSEDANLKKKSQRRLWQPMDSNRHHYHYQI